MQKIALFSALLILAGVGCTTTTQFQNVPIATPACDVGTLCLQESQNEGGIFGVARIEAHYVGEKTFFPMGTDAETCPMMAIDSANDDRVLEDITDENGEHLFAISKDEVEWFSSTTAEDPAPLTIYISERVGRGTGPCTQRVHIIN